FFDVAVRRIALEPARVTSAAQRVWSRLRGQATVADQTPQYLDRLKSRKAQVSETLGEGKAARRFEGGDAPVSAPLGATDEPPPTDRPLTPPRERPGFAPESEKQEEGDYGSRLLRAKKRVWREQDKDRDQ